DIVAIEPRIDGKRAGEIGRAMAKGGVLSLIGRGERFVEAQLVYRLLYLVFFSGRRTKPTHEQRSGRLYLHSRTLEVFAFSRDGGVRFLGALPEKAGELGDFTGMDHTVELRPGDLTFNEAEWRARLPAPAVKKRVREGLKVSPATVKPVFFPLWRILIR